MTLQGGCLCGRIRYEIDGPLTDVGNCHCSMCRRFHGAAFSTYAKVGADHFRWLSGQELLSAYETSPGIGWAFCRICGSSLGIPAQGKLSEITLGTLDADPGVRPARHIFVGSKAAWFEINDTLPQHDAWPQGKLEQGITDHPIARWHSILERRDPSGLAELLAEDAAFFSPIVHKPQAGRAITTLYLTAAFDVFCNDSFHYVRQIIGPNDAMLEFETTIDGTLVNGVDIIKWNTHNQIVEFKVMVRPLKAINLIHERMAAVLHTLKGHA